MNIISNESKPYNLPETFEWYNVDVDVKTDLIDLHNFLSDNYVSDDKFNFLGTK